MEEVKKFEVGKHYFTRSICDHNCIFAYTIINRTAKTVTIQDEFGKIKGRRKIYIYNGKETINPEGNYSMSPTVDAGDLLPGEGELKELVSALHKADMQKHEEARKQLLASRENNLDNIAAKVHQRFPYLKFAYERNKAYWAWLCVYTTAFAEILTFGEVEQVVKLSDDYAGGRAAIR